MSKIFPNKKSFVALLASLSIAASQTVTASASEESDNSDTVSVSEYSNQEITPELLDQAFEELDKSDAPRTVNEDSTVTFHLDGVDLTLRDPHAITPYVSAGKEDGGFWIELTPVEQDLVVSGGAYALGATICAIPFIGTSVCAVVELAITAASIYLSHHNKPCDDRVKFHYGWDGQVKSTECT